MMVPQARDCRAVRTGENAETCLMESIKVKIAQVKVKSFRILQRYQQVENLGERLVVVEGARFRLLDQGTNGTA